MTMVTHRHTPDRREAIRGGCGRTFPGSHAPVHVHACSLPDWARRVPSFTPRHMISRAHLASCGTTIISHAQHASSAWFARHDPRPRVIALWFGYALS
jgi:hypothetical protein